MSNKNPRRAVRPVRTFLSLFSGCGGLDLGFVNAGFRCLSAYDIDDRALAVHSANLPGRTIQWDLSTGVLPHGFDHSPDVILAGSPCQGFSTIGKRELDDLRNTLLIAAGKIATRIAPRVFVAENVPAVNFGSHRKYWSALVEILQLAGYCCESLYLSASDFGVAQMRRRLFLVAIANGRSAALMPKPRTRKTLRDVIGDLTLPKEGMSNHDPEPLDPTSTHFRIAKHIRGGQKLCNVRVSQRAVHTWDIPDVFGAISNREREVLMALLRIRRRERLREYGDADPVLPSSIARAVRFPVDDEIKSLLAKDYIRKVGKRIDLRHTFNGKYRRLTWDALSFTVDTSFGSPKNFLHPELHRGFTVREAARIQGFPDSFRFSGAVNDQFRFIGNAVPPPMAQALAAEIAAILND